MPDAEVGAAGAVKSDTQAGMIVLVDDDPMVLMTLARVLRGVGQVATCAGGSEAVARVRRGGVDVVVSDVNMPGMTGLQLLRALRALDQDLPVVLVTGEPTVEVASKAIEFGVFRYLAKPFDGEELRRTVRQASQLYRLARIKREALGLAGVVGASDRVGLEVSFERALELLHVVFQPIVSLSGRSVYGYEALMRSAEPALPAPGQLLDAAERLGLLHELGRTVRQWAVELFRGAPDGRLLFLNLHPENLRDPALFDWTSPLALLADRVVFEITERASLTGVEDVGERIAALRARGFRIALDDLGTGYAGLASFAILEPDFVKLDATLVRGIDSSPARRKLVASMATLCDEMGVGTIVEGVETPGESDTLRELGCDLHQGHLYARPAPPFPEPVWR